MHLIQNKKMLQLINKIFNKKQIYQRMGWLPILSGRSNAHSGYDCFNGIELYIHKRPWYKELC